MKKVILILVFLLTISLCEISFSTPGTPTIDTPKSAQGYTLNRRPWIYFSATDSSGHQINDAQVQIATDSGFTTIVYDRKASAGNATFFYPLPASSGQLIRHRVQSNLNYNTTYYIRVKVWCSNTVNRESAWSSTVQIYISSPNWVDPTITAGTTLIRAQHFTQLRTVINNLRAFRGYGAYTFQDGTLSAGTTRIRAIHMTELRDALKLPYYKTTGSYPTYSDDPISTGTTKIRAIHINELRNYATYP